MSCKASLAALRLYGYFCDFCFVFVSENKYDDDDDDELVTNDSKSCSTLYCYLIRFRVSEINTNKLTKQITNY